MLELVPDLLDPVLPPLPSPYTYTYTLTTFEATPFILVSIDDLFASAISLQDVYYLQNPPAPSPEYYPYYSFTPTQAQTDYLPHEQILHITQEALSNLKLSLKNFLTLTKALSK